MGTNYYWHPSGTTVCPCCEQPTPSLHIGKSSYGWFFSLRIHPSEGIHTLDDWKEKWATGLIVDEYGDAGSVDEMLECITNREKEWKTHAGYTTDYHESSARYGGPTWDLCDYEFS